ncbi:MAG TPA: hypothetical protein PLV16_10165 [Agitococcus sp.]|nr:hypothetical protein [Agitococcus sp.]
MLLRHVCHSIFALSLLSSVAQAYELKSELRLESTNFFEQGAQQQSQFTGSIAAQVEVNQALTNSQQLQLRVFGRVDEQDNHRSGLDVREALWTYAQQAWQVRAGVGQVFWGTTEAQHLVDIVNQTDYLASLDGDVKLGQPLVNVSWEQNQHLVDFYVLPYFRERPFAGADGRLRLPYVIDSEASYESSAKRQHLDVAFRYQFNQQNLRVGLSGFSGTSREPILSPVIDPSQFSYMATPFGFVPTGFVGNYQPYLQVYYPIIQQLGIDAQYIIGDCLLKLEAIDRHGFGQRYQGVDTGLEYTQVRAFDSNVDVGWLAEYLYDSRNNTATTSFEHDVFVGWRFAFNDASSSELLTGVISDIHSHEQAWKIKGSTRLNDSSKISMEGRFFHTKQDVPSPFSALSTQPSDEKLYPLADDSFLRAEFSYYF